MDNTWDARDRPVLEKIVELVDEASGNDAYHGVQVATVREATELEGIDVMRAVLALEGAYIEVVGGGVGFGGSAMIVRVTPAAREIAGQWPVMRGRAAGASDQR